MISSKLNVFSRELDFANDGDKVYGVYDGYLISITEKDQIRTMYTDVVFNESMMPQMAQTRDFLNDSVPQYAISAYDIKPTGIKIDFNMKGVKFDAFIDFFYNFLTVLKEFHVPGYSTCSSCGKPISGSPVIVSIGQYVHSCDKACSESLVTSRNKTSETPAAFVPRNAGGKTGPGVLGVFFGSLLGMVFWFGAHRFGLGFYAVFTAILIGLFAHGGYHIFGGRKNGARFVSCTILPVFAVIAAEFISFCATVADNWAAEGIIYTAMDAIKSVWQSIVSNTETTIVFMREVGMGIILVVAVAILFSFLGQKKKAPARKTDSNSISILEY